MIKYYPATNAALIGRGGVSVGGDSDYRRRSNICTGVFLFGSSGSGGGQVLFYDGKVVRSGSGSG